MLPDEGIVLPDPLEEPFISRVEDDLGQRWAVQAERREAVGRGVEQVAIERRDMWGALDEAQVPVGLERLQLRRAEVPEVGRGSVVAAFDVGREVEDLGEGGDPAWVAGLPPHINLARECLVELHDHISRGCAWGT